MAMTDETLEEAAKKYRKTTPNQMFGDELGFIDGAKWQADRSYSEEEVILLIAEAICKFKLGKLHDEEQIIESLLQFKKK